MKIKVIRLGVLTCFLFLFSCEDTRTIADFDDNPIEKQATKILLHCPCNDFIHLDFDTCLKGIDSSVSVQGMEVDVILSKDNTLWLRHDEYYVLSGDTVAFNDLSDSVIVADKLAQYTLQDVFAYLKEHHADWVVSVDVKPNSSLYRERRDVMEETAKQIVDAQKKYGLKNVLVETWDITIKRYVLEYSKDIKVFLITWNDFESAILWALKHKIHGVSIAYEEAPSHLITLANKKGLEVQVWTVTNAMQLDSCVLLKPQYIQGDFIAY